MLNDGQCEYCLGESTIRGWFINALNEKNDLLEVTDIDISGEFSGTFWEWIVKPALAKSTGQLDAVLVWEGGDRVEKIVVDNGEITETEIDLTKL